MTDFPRNLDFLHTIRQLEDRCVDETWAVLPQTGKQVPRCLAALGDLLSLTYQASSCYWGCSGPEHSVNHLAVRVASASAASLRCLACGYYDESLVLTRCVGELANLLLLFVRRPEKFLAWKRAAQSERRKHFSPVAVRFALEGMGVKPPIDQARYAAITETGVHITPDTTPQAHNPRGRAVLGQIFQLPGAIMALTELSIATSVAAHSASRLLELPEDVVAEFDRRTHAVIEGLPGIDIMNVRDLLRSLQHGGNSPDGAVDADGDDAV